ncbi:hypothetical protein HDE_13724 [Halotydeus destructor]|nr:hypothetical protein HDE_13724 [Halotydeus destructor]
MASYQNNNDGVSEPFARSQDIPSATVDSSPGSAGGQTNLIKLFLAAKKDSKCTAEHLSPSSSGQTSSSLSFTSQSQESEVSGNSSPSANNPLIRPYSVSQDRQRNNNHHTLSPVLSSFDVDDSFTLEDLNCLVPPKFNRIRQTSPIREQDEEGMTDSSRADVSMASASDDLGYLAQQFNVRGNSQQPQLTFTTRGVSTMSRHSDELRNKDESSVPRSALECDYALNCAWKDDLSSLSSDLESVYRPSAQDWLKRTNAFSTAKGYNSSNKTNNLLSTRTTSTQVPVYIQDKEVQTQTSGTYKRTQFVMRDLPTQYDFRLPGHEEETRPNCGYPGYAHCAFYDMPKKAVYSPSSKFNPVQLRTNQNIKSKRIRPKSLDDFERLSKRSFSHIRDWDSLNILLPNEFKTLIERIQNRGHQQSQSRHSSSDSQQRSHQDREGGPSCNGDAAGVRLRSPRRRLVRDTSLNNLSDRTGGAMCGCGDQRSSRLNKRFSLQEAGYGDEYMLSRPPEMRGKFLTRSETMPCCRPAWTCRWQPAHGQQWCQATPQVQGCYRSPCLSPMSSGHTDPSIDQLREILSMDNTLEEVADLLKKAAVLSPTKLPQDMSPRGDVTPKKDSFINLKQHWEAVAESLNQPNMNGKGSYIVAKNPKSTVRPASAVDVSTRPVGKPPVPDKTSVTMRQTNNTDSPRRAVKRPVSLNTHSFRSMIPVPTGSRTPNRLNSPVTASKCVT